MRITTVPHSTTVAASSTLSKAPFSTTAAHRRTSEQQLSGTIDNADGGAIIIKEFGFLSNLDGAIKNDGGTVNNDGGTCEGCEGLGTCEGFCG